MTEETTREVPEDQRRRQILTIKPVREYIRERTEENGKTYSKQVDEWLPDDWESVTHEFRDDNVVNIKATPGVHEKIDSMTGQRVKPGETLALYVLAAAVENGDLEVAQDIVANVPNLLWDAATTEETQ